MAQNRVDTVFTKAEMNNIYKGIIRLQERDSLQELIITELTHQNQLTDSLYRTEKEASKSYNDLYKMTNVKYQMSLERIHDIEKDHKKEKVKLFFFGMPVGAATTALLILLL